MEKSWLDVEMEESLSLLRKRLDVLNDSTPEYLTGSDTHEIKEIYQAIHEIMCIKKMAAENR